MNMHHLSRPVVLADFTLEPFSVAQAAMITAARSEILTLRPTMSLGLERK
jgi:hypothetical protein